MANQRLVTEPCYATEAPPSNLMEVLRFWAKRYPDRHVYTFQRDDGHETSLDYGALDRRARAIAALLQQTCSPGDRALLLYPAGLDFIAAFCGCAYAGVLAVPVCYPKPKRPMPRLQAISQDAQPRVALTNRKTLDQFDFHLLHSDLPREAWIASDDAPDSWAEEWRAPTIAAGDLAFLQYTSGSTSNPKGVMVSHGNLLHNLEAIRRGFGIDFDLETAEPRNKGVFWLPAYHDMGLIGGILTAMYVGGHSLLMSPSAFLQRPARWLEAISAMRARISGAPNFAFDLCVSKIPSESRKELDLSSWEICFCGAEPIRAETLQAFAQTFAESGFRGDAFYPCYGLAENTLMAAGGKGPSQLHVESVRRDALGENRIVEADDAHPVHELVCCGGPVSDQQIAIVDPQSRCRRAPGEIGEVWIKGRSVALGYWNRLEESHEVFRARLADGDGPYLRTGDLGALLEGKLYVTGRLKDVIIIRGRNHYPQDVERTVERCHEALRPNAGVAVATDVQGEEALVVIHEVDRAHRDADLVEVIRRIRRAVADEHEVHPHAIVLIRHASIPITTSGKVQRGLARRLYLAGELKVLEEWVAPQSSAISLRSGPDPVYGAKHVNGNGSVNGNRNGNGANGHPLNQNGHARYLGNGHSSGNGKANGNGRHPVNGSQLAIPNGSGNADAQGQSPGAFAAPGSSVNGAARPNGAPVNGRLKRNGTRRIHFEHFPLSADEIDRLAERIEKWILEWMIEHAAVSRAEIDRHRPFAEYGMDSLTAVELSHQLEEWLGVELTAVIAWNYPTPHKISQYLARTVGGADPAEAAASDSTQESASGDDFERLLAEIENLSEREAQNALSRDGSS